MSLMKFMSLFEAVTRAKLRDCFIDDSSLLTFVVEDGSVGRAVGKRGANVRLLEKKLNRKIKIVEFNSDLTRFIENLVYPLKLNGIEEESGIVTLIPADSKTRGMLIGRAAQNLRNYESIVKRYFSIDELKVK